MSARLTPQGDSIRRGYIDVGGGQVHYASTAETDAGLPLVLLHQTASSWLGYLPLLRLLDGEFRVVALDTPGFGGSDPLAGDVSVKALGEVVVEALELLGVDAFWLYGHHTGSTLAAWIAAHYPQKVKRMILSGPTYLDEAQKRRISGVVGPTELQEDGSHLLEAWSRHRRLAAECELEVPQRELTLFFTAHEPHITYEAVIEADFPAWLGLIECPTYVMGGENDTIRSGLKPTHEALSNSEIESVPGAGIYLTDQVPELVADRIRSWFR